ncbi:MAG: PSD1 and planctomycete cytochrome C domain-containing protein [Pirellulaceae bacterium]|nr:PSD1 domain-containing protein [Planctomycetales bacterium]
MVSRGTETAEVICLFRVLFRRRTRRAFASLDRPTSFPAIVLAVILASAAIPTDAVGQREEDFFESRIRPVLADHCVTCHGSEKAESNLRVDSLESMLRGGDGGPAIVPGHADRSRLLAAIKQEGDLAMPPDYRLDDQQVAGIEKWITDGAAWPPDVTINGGGPALRSGMITDEERAFWSYQPVVEPPVPQNGEFAYGDSDIDRFVADRLQREQLSMRPRADRRTLIRRATFDLTGLPPTPEEIEAFLRDESPNAFTNVIDRLLASSAYGEQWGRHWLDVVRYADTAGETADYPTPLSYKYRNWVIQAFNDDLPYDSFVQYQLAGDILADRLAASTIGNSSSGADGEISVPPELLDRCRSMRTATGFIAVSRRFGFDVENYHYLTIQDTIDVVGQSLLGLTLGCARCHDHKYDPVNMSDYYGWYGIFASTRYSFPGSEEKKKPYDLYPAIPQLLLLTVGKEVASSDSDLIYGAVEQDSPADSQIQLRGEPTRLGDTVSRKNLEILGGEELPPDAGSGRLQLADWITGDDNPLFARVMVNRIWQYHFGEGLVATENDFGVRGTAPTHADLLDWLACRFRESGYSVKSMHRLIMNSHAYQQSCEHDSLAAQRDPDGSLLWRFRRRRLSAEELRDAMLSVSGTLDQSIGQRHPFPAIDTWGFTQHTPFYAVYPTNRRSIYLMQQRLKRHPYLALFDGADPNASTASRQLTTVPTQALFLMNSQFVHDQATAFVHRIGTVADTQASRLQAAYSIALGRPATDEEETSCERFLDTFAMAALQNGNSQADARLLAWQALARTLLTRNEFLFVE